jgi:hypothetical protein
MDAVCMEKNYFLVVLDEEEDDDEEFLVLPHFMTSRRLQDFLLCASKYQRCTDLKENEIVGNYQEKFIFNKFTRTSC